MAPTTAMTTPSPINPEPVPLFMVFLLLLLSAASFAARNGDIPW
jgi:hypothetical protein